MNKYQEALNYLDWHCNVEHKEQQGLLQELIDYRSQGGIVKEFVLFNKQGERIDSVDPYYMHKVVGNKVIVTNDMFEHELSLENGNTFEIVRMEETK